MGNYDELIKALRNCSCVDGQGSCAKCAYKHSEFSCKWKMMIDAADAIEKLTAEVEKQKSLVSEYKKSYHAFKQLYEYTQAELCEIRGEE